MKMPKFRNSARRLLWRLRQSKLMREHHGRYNPSVGSRFENDIAGVAEFGDDVFVRFKGGDSWSQPLKDYNQKEIRQMIAFLESRPTKTRKPRKDRGKKREPKTETAVEKPAVASGFSQATNEYIEQLREERDFWKFVAGRFWHYIKKLEGE